jgi:hypothetical protein
MILPQHSSGWRGRQVAADAVDGRGFVRSHLMHSLGRTTTRQVHVVRGNSSFAGGTISPPSEQNNG